jgi:hypothetical protein
MCHELLDGHSRDGEALRVAVVSEEVEARLDPHDEGLVGVIWQIKATTCARTAMGQERASEA